MRKGQNNRGYKNPDNPQWGVRTFWTSHGLVWAVQWHSKHAKLNQYLRAKGMTQAQAHAMCRLLKRGALGE